MFDPSVEAIKTLMYFQKALFKEASKSNFSVSICLQSKGFKVHIPVNQMSSSQVSNNNDHYHFYEYYQIFFVKV